MTFNGWANWHTWHLYTCLTSYDDSREYFEQHPEKVQQSVTSQIAVWLQGSRITHKEAIQAFIQGGLTSEAKDIRWFAVQEQPSDLTEWEKLAVKCNLAGKGELLIHSIYDWVEQARVRAGKTDLSTFCEEGLKMIVARIDWQEVEKTLKG